MFYDTYYLDVNKEDYTTILPNNDWFCCAIANKNFDDSNNSLVEKFIRFSIDMNILAWHGLGSFGGKLHLTFDFIMVKMEIDEGHSEIDVCTIGFNDSDIANGFWACYGAPSLNDNASYEFTKLVCLSFDEIDYRNELKMLIAKFNTGWLPPETNEGEANTH